MLFAICCLRVAGVPCGVSCFTNEASVVEWTHSRRLDASNANAADRIASGANVLRQNAKTSSLRRHRSQRKEAEGEETRFQCIHWHFAHRSFDTNRVIRLRLSRTRGHCRAHIGILKEDLAWQVVVKAVTAGEHPELSKLLTESGWLEMLSEEFRCDYFTKLQTFLEMEWDDPKTVVYPPVGHIFNAFEMTPFKKYSPCYCHACRQGSAHRVRVVLLGQDPYHGVNQATGLSFSVPQSARLPSSLRNVYKEIKSDLGYDPGSHGDLTKWATQVSPLSPPSCS